MLPRYGPWHQVILLRDLKGMRSVDLARAAGISRGYMSDLELGRRWPTHTVTVKIATALDAPPNMIARQRQRRVAS